MPRLRASCGRGIAREHESTISTGPVPQEKTGAVVYGAS
jgi:hypothetical protein